MLLEYVENRICMYCRTHKFPIYPSYCCEVFCQCTAPVDAMGHVHWSAAQFGLVVPVKLLDLGENNQLLEIFTHLRLTDQYLCQSLLQAFLTSQKVTHWYDWNKPNLDPDYWCGTIRICALTYQDWPVISYIRIFLFRSRGVPYHCKHPKRTLDLFVKIMQFVSPKITYSNTFQIKHLKNTYKI